MTHVAVEIQRLNRLKDVPHPELAASVAYLYDYANFAHPFREGNGRSTREFFDLLLSERPSLLEQMLTTGYGDSPIAVDTRALKCGPSPRLGY